jgi:hypothetical protein
MTPEAWAELEIPGHPNDPLGPASRAAFRKVVADVVRQAVAEEREECARIAKQAFDVYNIGNCIAAAIRARSES